MTHQTDRRASPRSSKDAAMNRVVTVRRATKLVVTMADVTRADVTMADVTRADTKMADVTMADVKMADVKMADVTMADTTMADVTSRIEIVLNATEDRASRDDLMDRRRMAHVGNGQIVRNVPMLPPPIANAVRKVNVLRRPTDDRPSRDDPMDRRRVVVRKVADQGVAPQSEPITMPAHDPRASTIGLHRWKRKLPN